MCAYATILIKSSIPEGYYGAFSTVMPITIVFYLWNELNSFYYIALLANIPLPTTIFQPSKQSEQGMELNQAHKQSLY